ncbi:MAG: hypothetical protein FD133_769 [Erysipelotrichaceae bacterium]|nr:MAG: hypothetical protein FD179_1210 [Erysipelotrichaceae bacterium]TXT18610.1 MAG: hypothetical protein FD133_769 [Erysipelotrichaceae bacterium]
MDKIEHFDQVINLIKREEILFIIKPQRIYFAQKGDMIQAKSEQAQYLIPWVTFIELFESSDFYVYEKKEELLVDKAKDDEYYQWKHK